MRKKIQRLSVTKALHTGKDKKILSNKNVTLKPAPALM